MLLDSLLPPPFLPFADFWCKFVYCPPLFGRASFVVHLWNKVGSPSRSFFGRCRYFVYESSLQKIIEPT